jgi:thiol-disulfide isomerase/thioredoxin
MNPPQYEPMSTPAESAHRSLWARMVDVVLVGLAIVAVFIAIDARRGGDNADIANSVATPPDLPVPRLGQSLPSVMTRGDGAGAAVFTPDVEFLAGRVHALYFFRTDCPHCESIVPSWHRLLGDSGSAVRHVAVAAEDRSAAHGWALEHDLRFDTLVAAASPQELYRRWNVVAVPGLVLLSPSGEVIHAAFGVPAAGIVPDLSALLAAGH